MTGAVVVLGSLHLDVMVDAARLPRQGETLAGRAFAFKCGGKGGNQAVAAALHGASSAMIGAVGRDAFGGMLMARLRAAGVDVAGVAEDERLGSGMSVAIQEAEGDYGAVIVSGCNLAIDAARVALAAPAIRAAAVLLLQNEIPDTANLAAARLAQEAGVMAILNGAPARPLPEALGERLDLLAVNAIEAHMLGAGCVQDGQSALAAARVLLEQARAVVVTAGAAGIAYASRGGERFVLGAHDVALRSTHGAGDAFLGALAARLAARETIADALRYANAAAACAVSTEESDEAGRGPAATLRLLAG